MKQRIWFNRWFNSAFYFINLIREGDVKQRFEFYGTHINKNTIVALACDHFELEPELFGKTYVDYCLDYCMKNKINIFIPNHEQVHISEYIKEFEKIGTKVMVSSDYKMLQTITDKGKFYKACKETDIFNIPEHYIVNTVDKFSDAYASIVKNGHKTCIKPLKDNGGSGFRVIDDNASTFKNLLGDINHKISFDETIKILSKQETFQDIMVMEYLEGFEYSIDCLGFNGELLAAIPRKKIDSRVRALQDFPKFVELARRTEELYKLPYIFNIQIKYSQGIPKLLEINPRMSGGLDASCLCGINFPYLAVMLLLGEEVVVPEPRLNLYSTQIEKRFILNER